MTKIFHVKIRWESSAIPLVILSVNFLSETFWFFIISFSLRSVLGQHFTSSIGSCDFFSFSKKCNRISLKCSNSQGGQSDININQLFNINGMCCAFSKKVLQSKILFSSCFSLFYFRKESFLLNFFFLQYLTNEGGHGRRTNSR